jgi:ornithine carbamoyltransferase
VAPLAFDTVHALLRSDTVDPWLGASPERVLGTARGLQARRGEAGHQPLRGKHFGLLCSDPGAPAGLLFRVAAHGLGARVSQVAPLDADAVRALGATAYLLGRLYDAIECQGLSALVVANLRAQAGIPVYGGVATPEHPSARLADALEGNAGERRLLVLQAMLLVSLS